MAIIPLPLKAGGRIAVISPAGPVGEDETKRGVEFFERLGYKLDLMPHALMTGNQSYLAASDTDRAVDLEQALTNDRYDAVFCTRGGYGSMRLLPLLNYNNILKKIKRKPFVGFSDISALQWALHDRSAWITWSGPQLARGFGGEDRGEGFGGLDRFSGECWMDALQGRMWGKVLPMPEGKSLNVLRDGLNLLGPILGGNLAVLAALCGTPFQPSFAGGIAVLEEIDEPLYRIDRMITQLSQSGVFKGVRGILLGRFVQHVQGEAVDLNAEAAEIVMDAVPGVPVVTGAPYGHVGPCWTLPIGAEATLDLKQKTLTLEKRQS
ncbi:putative murein peptide carboxypeptidase [bacterium BMS3Bbin04]|nr:putative murein peptide carboxypeptidase [bacterium BMS3Bbin04]